VLKLRGLPFSASREDVVAFFDGTGLNITTAEVVVPTQADGRASGEAYVRFQDAEAARTASQKDRCMMGSRYVEMFVSSQDEWQIKSNSQR